MEIMKTSVISHKTLWVIMNISSVDELLEIIKSHRNTVHYAYVFKDLDMYFYHGLTLDYVC